MLSPTNYQAPDFSQYENMVESMEDIHRQSGRRIYAPDFYAAVKAGHIKPFLVAGRSIYHKADIEAFAKKWGERVKP